MRQRRIGRTAAIAGLCVAAVACGNSSSLPAHGDGSAGSDAQTRKPDAGSIDAGKASDAGPIDAAGPSDAAPFDAGRPTDAGAPDAGGSSDAGPPACPIPLAPDLSIIASNEVLDFVVTGSSPIEIATLPAASALATAVFQTTSSLSLAALSGPTRILAQTAPAGCAFNAVSDVRATYAPAPPDATTTAVAYDDPRIVAWASGAASYLPGPGVTLSQYMMPSQAFGPAGTNTLAVVTLGNGGSITLTFDAPITDGPSWDFAVYENSFASDIFLELAFVEVSSDGTHFARFDSAFQSQVTPGLDSSGIAAQIGGLAGTYMVGYGTPFDLSALENAPAVRSGTVDLGAIKYVRIVDIIGDGTTPDSFGRGIVDPISSGPTAGFDLDGIAVLNQKM